MKKILDPVLNPGSKMHAGRKMSKNVISYNCEKWKKIIWDPGLGSDLDQSHNVIMLGYTCLILDFPVTVIECLIAYRLMGHILILVLLLNFCSYLYFLDEKLPTGINQYFAP